MEKMPTPTPQPEEVPLTPQTPEMEDLSNMPSYEEHMSSMRQELTHTDSPNPTKNSTKIALYSREGFNRHL